MHPCTSPVRVSLWAVGTPTASVIRMAHSVAAQPANHARTLELAIVLALTAALLSPALSHAATGDPVLINEVLVSHTGTPDDTEFLELYGTPGASLAGLSLLVVEGDSGGVPGTVDRRLDFGADARLGGNGFFLVGNPTGLATHYKVVPDLSIGNDWFENGSQTLALAQTSSLGSEGVPLTGGESVLDAVGLADTGSTDAWFFGAPVVGPDDGFLAPGARRLVDGVDTDSAADWAIADDLLGPANTPTAATPFNAPPTADCGMPLATDAGSAVTASVSAADPDGRVVAFDLAVNPDPGTVTMGAVMPATTPGENATAQVEVGSTTPAGSYVVEVSAWTDDAVPQQATCELAVTVNEAPPTAQPPMAGLVAKLEAFVADGSVAGSKAHQLSERIERVARFDDHGQQAAAMAQLRAFVNQVRGLSPRWVTPDAAETLATMAQDLAAAPSS